MDPFESKINFKIGEVVSDEEAMDIAVALAQKGQGFVSPNPPVGCVITDSQGKILSTGYHKKVGDNHAEINAAKELKDAELKGARVFVTLEPCSHEGRTPSCAKALAKWGVEEVIYGIEDPNPMVSGKGIEILESSNIKVRKLDSKENICRGLAEIFFHNQLNQTPFVSLKMGASLDGKTSMSSGESQWITSESSREYSNFLRGVHDAVLVGAGTLIKDDPSLNLRTSEFKDLKENKIIIVDPKGKLSGDLKKYKVSSIHKKENIILVSSTNTGGELDQAHGQFIEWNTQLSEDENIAYLLKSLFELHIFSVFVEGGAQTFSWFLNSKNAQKIYCFIAPKILGGQFGVGWSDQYGSEKLGESIQILGAQYKSIGDNILVTGRID